MLTDQQKNKLKTYLEIKQDPALAVFRAIEVAKEEAQKIATAILEKELARIEQTLDKKFETFLESGRGERIVERIIGDTDIAGQILKTGLTLKGAKGDQGDKPIAGIDYPIPENGYTPIKNKDYFDGKDANEKKIEQNVLAQIKIPAVKDIENAIIKELPTLGTAFRDGLELLQGDERLDKKFIKGLDEELSKIKTETNSRLMGLGAAGGAKGRVHIYDASSQLNGILKTFSIPLNFGILGVFSTQFPLIFRPIIDYTVGNKSITLTSAVSAPATGQSLIIQYIK